MKAINYELGTMFGEVEYLGEDELRKRIGGGTSRYAKFKCPCGNEFIQRLADIKNSHIISCGCRSKDGKIRIKPQLKNGNKYYGIWLNIKHRCYNPDNVGYKNCGGRGITLQEDWIYDFDKFYLYISELPNFDAENYSIDRIDNNLGYYEGNLRFADRHTQTKNTRRKETSTNEYEGVYLQKSTGKYIAELRCNGVTKRICTKPTAKEALNVRNKYIIDNNLTEYKIQ